MATAWPVGRDSEKRLLHHLGQLANPVPASIVAN